MIVTVLKHLKKGSYFIMANSKKLFVRNHFDRSTKKYSISYYDDVNKERFVKSDLKVYVTDINDIVPKFRHFYRNSDKYDLLTVYKN